MQAIYAGKKATLSIGNIKPIGEMPEGAIICNVEEVQPQLASLEETVGLALNYKLMQLLYLLVLGARICSQGLMRRVCSRSEVHQRRWCRCV